MSASCALGRRAVPHLGPRAAHVQRGPETAGCPGGSSLPAACAGKLCPAVPTGGHGGPGMFRQLGGPVCVHGPRCVCVCAFACMCKSVYMYVCVCACPGMCVYTHGHLYVHRGACMCVGHRHVCTGPQACTCARMCTGVRPLAGPCPDFHAPQSLGFPVSRDPPCGCWAGPVALGPVLGSGAQVRCCPWGEGHGATGTFREWVAVAGTE